MAFRMSRSYRRRGRFMLCALSSVHYDGWPWSTILLPQDSIIFETRLIGFQLEQGRPLGNFGECLWPHWPASVAFTLNHTTMGMMRAGINTTSHTTSNCITLHHISPKMLKYSQYPRLPQELLDNVIDLIDDFDTVKNCSLAGRACRPRCKARLFRKV